MARPVVQGAENHDLAKTDRDKLIETIGVWYVEAGKYDVMARQ
jgi:hypothetical protein